MQNGSCVKLGGKCIGSNFENATLIPGDDQNLKTDVPKTLVVDDTPAKCEYKCNAGYTWQNGICGKKSEKFFPEMHIDKIENCKIWYHFNEFDPIKGGCCAKGWLEVSSNPNRWGSPFTTTYTSPLGSRGLEGEEGMIYFRYRLGGSKGEYSPVYSYNMTKQTNCKEQEDKKQKYGKKFFNDQCLEWVTNGLYSETGSLVTTIDERYHEDCYGFGENVSCSYKLRFKHDGKFLNALHIGDYVENYSKRDEIYKKVQRSPGDSITLYAPSTSNQWAKITLELRGSKNNKGYSSNQTRFVSNVQYYGNGTLKGDCYY